MNLVSIMLWAQAWLQGAGITCSCAQRQGNAAARVAEQTI